MNKLDRQQIESHLVDLGATIDRMRETLSKNDVSPVVASNSILGSCVTVVISVGMIAQQAREFQFVARILEEAQQISEGGKPE